MHKFNVNYCIARDFFLYRNLFYLMLNLNKNHLFNVK